MLKTDEANVQQLMMQTFKLIIDRLTKISNIHMIYTSIRVRMKINLLE